MLIIYICTFSLKGHSLQWAWFLKKDRNSFSTAPSLSSRYHFEGIIVITQDTLSTDETILEAILGYPVIAWSQDGESSMTTVNGRYDMPRRSFRRSCISTFHRSGEDWRCFFRFFHSKVNDLDFRDPFKNALWYLNFHFCWDCRIVFPFFFHGAPVICTRPPDSLPWLRGMWHYWAASRVCQDAQKLPWVDGSCWILLKRMDAWTQKSSWSHK